MRSRRRTKIAFALTVLCAAAGHPAAFAAPGDLDPRFGRFGKRLIEPAHTAISNGFAVQPDGKPLIGGLSFAGGTAIPTVFRLNVDGSLDQTFGAGGAARLPRPLLGAGAIEVDSAGRIVVSGRTGEVASSTLAAARVTADGSPDPSFGVGGLDDTGVKARTIFGAANLALAPDGRILLGAGTEDSSSLIVLRRLADGGPDPSFSEDGTAAIPLGARSIGGPVAVAADGSVLAGAGGTAPAGAPAGALVKLGVGGELEPSFAAGGIAWTTFDGGAQLVADVAIGPDGSPHAIARERVTQFGAHSFIARYTTAGALDPGFGGDGWFAAGSWPFAAQELAVQPDRRLVVANGGFNGDAQVLRYRADGSRDRRFADRGRATIDFGGDLDTARNVAIGPGGKLAIGGLRGVSGFRSDDFDLAAARLLNGGRRHDLDADGVIDRKDRCPKVSSKARGGCPFIARQLRLKYSRKRTFKGRVSSDKFGCRSAGRVRVFEQVRGRDPVVRSTGRIEPNGSYEMPARSAEGTFYARLRARVVADAGRCGAARSKTIVVGR